MNIVSADLELKGAKGRGNQIGAIDDFFSGGVGSGDRELRSGRGYN
jgi:hypothetical protein